MKVLYFLTLWFVIAVNATSVREGETENSEIELDFVVKETPSDRSSSQASLHLDASSLARFCETNPEAAACLSDTSYSARSLQVAANPRPAVARLCDSWPNLPRCIESFDQSSVVPTIVEVNGPALTSSSPSQAPSLFCQLYAESRLCKDDEDTIPPALIPNLPPQEEEKGPEQSDQPSDQPSDVPSGQPSDIPSDIPSDQPSDIPSDQPSLVPTVALSTSAPTIFCQLYAESRFCKDDEDTIPPALIPNLPPQEEEKEPEQSDQPSDQPSDIASDQPSYLPTEEPSLGPTVAVTYPAPTSAPTIFCQLYAESRLCDRTTIPPAFIPRL